MAFVSSTPMSASAHFVLSTQPNEPCARGEAAEPPPGPRTALALVAALADDTTAGRRPAVTPAHPARPFWVWLSILGLSLLSYWFVNRFLVTSVIVQGRSMAPTLEDGQMCLLKRWAYFCNGPRRGDLVVLRDPGHADYAVKRIVGLPGESVLLKDGVVFVNGRRLREPYLAWGTQTEAAGGRTSRVVLPAETFYVLGDNRPVSEDSRYYGAIHRSRIIGLIAR
jgi:signal peptidase I